MNFDLVLLDNTSIGQEMRDILALITLELNDLAKLFINYNITVAAEFFLEIFQDLLVAEFFTQPLNCSQAFLSIPLLYPNMNILLCSRSTRLFRLRKRIKCCWDDLDVDINHENFLNKLLPTHKSTPPAQHYSLIHQISFNMEGINPNAYLQNEHDFFSNTIKIRHPSFNHLFSKNSISHKNSKLSVL